MVDWCIMQFWLKCSISLNICHFYLLYYWAHIHTFIQHVSVSGDIGVLRWHTETNKKPHHHNLQLENPVSWNIQTMQWEDPLPSPGSDKNMKDCLRKHKYISQQRTKAHYHTHTEQVCSQSSSHIQEKSITAEKKQHSAAGSGYTCIIYEHTLTHTRTHNIVRIA